MILFALAVAAAVSLADSSGPPSASPTPLVAAADPATINAVLAAARPGMTIRLVPGSYPQVILRNRNFDPPITVDASDATLAGVQLIGTSGVRWTGGSIEGLRPNDGGANFGFTASTGAQITIDGVHISGFRTGIVFDRITGGAVTGNWLARMTSDGIDLAASHNITVTRNACSDFHPADGAHPDCIQAWSRPDYPPTSDLAITYNSVVGSTQGIDLFNHVVDGVDQGSFDRVVVSNNTVLVTYGDGIGVYSCRGCSVRNNTVNSLPNYLNRAQLGIFGGSVEQCGNVVPMVPRQATPPCSD